ncbi:MAG: hypothetical protein AAF423_10410 [Pseudomonadota bacterium]
MKKFLLLTATLLAMNTSPVIAGDKVDFSQYAQSPAALSAIASAVSAAGGCSVPLTFEETKSDGERVLGVRCQGTEDDEVSIFIRFMDDGFSLLPVSFEYAG